MFDGGMRGSSWHAQGDVSGVSCSVATAMSRTGNSSMGVVYHMATKVNAENRHDRRQNAMLKLVADG